MKRPLRAALGRVVGDVVGAFTWLLLGAVAASFAWSTTIPDQPPIQPCVPLYDQTGLECCQQPQGEMR